MSLRNPRRSLVLTAILLALSAPVLAQSAATSTAPSTATEAVPAQVVSPEAQAILDRMTAYLRGLQSFSIDSDSTRDEVVSYGYKLQHNEHSRLIVNRPQQLRAEVTGDLRNRTFVYDGKSLVIHSPDDEVYTRAPATGNLNNLIGGLLDAGVELPLIDVLYQAGAGTLTEAVRGGVLVGDSTIEGVPCYQLAFRQANADFQLWIEKGDRPLPRKVVITTRYEVGDPQYSAVMSWNVQPKLDKSTFTFSAPKGTTEIPFADAAAIAERNQ
jgi:hypothetical protein